MKPSDIVTEAKKRFDRAKAYYGPIRTLEEADTMFALGDSDNGWQWPQDIYTARTSEKRVCLTINTTAEHCNQIINEIRQNRPTCKISPVDNGADKQTALLLGGLIRTIQAASNANDAHDTAAEHSVMGGEGYWRVVTEYEDEASFDQTIKIKPCVNPFMVYIDPAAKELDRSDAEWAFIFENQTKDSFKREYPKIDPASWVVDNTGWVVEDTFIRAEYFYCEYKDDSVILLPDGSTKLKSELVEMIGEDAIKAMGPLKERPTKIKQWKHCIIVGNHEEPLDQTDWPGKYLPIIRVVGKEMNVNGKPVIKGIVRDLKDPARIVNYAYSETVQTLALQNKIPYIAASEAIDGHEGDWQAANVSNAAYLPFNAYDESGNALPRPERQLPAVLPDAQVKLLDLSLNQMRGVSGQQNANFGIRSEAQSGIGIQRLKAQGEVATFHFPDNLSRGLTYEARILIDLIPKIYTREKIVRIMGLDGKESMAVLDPNLPGSFQKVKNDAIDKIFNPNVGRYDVVIDTGPSFQTQRQESAQILAEYTKANPGLMEVAGDIIMRANDFYLSDEIADRLQKTLPPNLLDEEDPKTQTVQLVGQLNQAQQQMQMMHQRLQELEQENQQLQNNERAKVLDVIGKQEVAQQNMEMKREEMAASLILEKEKANNEAEIAIYKANKEAETKQYIAQLNAATQPAKEPQEPEDIEEEKPKRKVITIQAPSGGVYTGVIEEQGAE